MLQVLLQITGVAKTFQSGYASIINKKFIQNMLPITTRGTFQENETITLNGEDSDLKISRN